MVADPSKEMALRNIVVEKPVSVDFRRRGRTGLKMYGGYVFEETLPQLQGQRAVDTYKEMADSDCLCGGILFAYDKMTRQVPWTTKRASDHPNDRRAEEFLQECMDDLNQNWTEVISEMLSFLQYGFNLHEIIYKKRGGRSDEPWLNSRYSDGRVGWRGFTQMAQSSIRRWLTNGYGEIVGVEQQAAPDYQAMVVPYEKLLHVRTQSQNANPEGRSILRSAYRSWYIKRGIENIEAVGVERDLAGYPVILAPSNVLARESDDASAMMDTLEQMVSNIRRDEQEGAIMPSERDDSGNLLYELKLLNSGGGRSIDTDKLVQRHDQRIALSMMADFMLLGQGPGSSGSFAMHQDKTALFTQALTTMLDIVEETFNRIAIPRLFDLNQQFFKINDYPQVAHGRVGTIDLKVMGEYVRNLTMAGAPIFPNFEAETFFAEIADIPPPKDPSMTADIVEPVGQGISPKVEHIHDGDTHPDDLTTDNAHPSVANLVGPRA